MCDDGDAGEKERKRTKRTKSEKQSSTSEALKTAAISASETKLSDSENKLNVDKVDSMMLPPEGRVITSAGARRIIKQVRDYLVLKSPSPTAKQDVNRVLKRVLGPTPETNVKDLFARRLNVITDQLQSKIAPRNKLCPEDLPTVKHDFSYMSLAFAPIRACLQTKLIIAAKTIDPFIQYVAFDVVNVLMSDVLEEKRKECATEKEPTQNVPQTEEEPTQDVYAKESEKPNGKLQSNYVSIPQCTSLDGFSEVNEFMLEDEEANVHNEVFTQPFTIGDFC